MQIKYSLKLALLLSFLAVQCKIAPQKSALDTDGKMFSLKTTECMGTCPVYTFIVYSNGNCMYKGAANVNNLGTFYGTLSSNQLNNLKEKLSTSDFFKLEVENNTLVKDLPSSYLYYNDGNNDRTIMYYNSVNKKAMELIELANELITNVEWNEK